MEPGATPLADDSLFDQAACGLLVTRENGEILRANGTFLNGLGYDASQLVGRRFQDLLTIGGKIFHQTHWLPLMRIQGSVREVKLEVLNGQKQRVVMLINGVRSERHGASYHHLAFFEMADRDSYEREILAARKAAELALQAKTDVEAALRQAKDELQATYELARDRALAAEQMVAIASHDLKTPLAAILMAGDLLKRSPSLERQHALAHLITQSAERADRLIRDFLDFTLVRVGQGIRIRATHGDLHEVVASAVSELRIAFAQAVIEHRHSGEGMALFDADRVRQLVANLVANSVAYGDLGEPVRVATEVTPHQLRVSVHNAGPAIPTEARATLFNAMSRGSDRGDARSVGLGLFIVREIARAHGGDVEVASDEGSGTVFTATMPVRRD